MGGSVGKIIDAVTYGSHSLIKKVGKVLGIYTHDETFSDIQIQNLLTPGAADKSARNTAIRQSGGDSYSYSQGYKGFQRNYRKKYSPQFLTSLGYAPNTTSVSRILNESGSFNYIQSIYPSITTMEEFKITFLSNKEVSFNYLQNNFNWNNSNETLTEGGKNYNSPIITSNETTLTIMLTRLFDETIIQNLSDNYVYDSINNTIEIDTGYKTAVVYGTSLPGTLETVVYVRNSLGNLLETKVFDTSVTKAWSFDTLPYGDGTYDVTVFEDTIQTDSYPIVINDIELYDVGAISPVSYDNLGVPSYKTIMTKQSNPLITFDVFTPVETTTKTTSDLNTEHLYVKFYKSGNTDWFSHIESINTVPTGLYTSYSIPMTAIIPVKENNVIYDLDSYKLKRMLRKINVEPEQLISSINNSDIDSLYIMTGIHPGATGEAINKALFQSLEYYSPGSGNVKISISNISMTYEFSLSRTDISGAIGAVGTYTKSIETTSSEPDPDTGVITNSSIMRLRWQASETVYRELIISNYKHTYVISGQTMITDLLGSSQYSRIIIPIGVLNGLRYREFVEVYEESLCMLAFSTETVEVKWYETGAFGTLLQIAGFVIAVVTYGLGAAIVAAVAAKIVVDALFKLLGPVFGAVAIAILAIVAAAYGVFSAFGETIKVTYLSAANMVLSSMNQAMSMKAEELAIKGQEELDAIAKEQEGLTELIDGLRTLDGGATISMFNDQFGYYAGSLNEPENYFYNMLGGNAFNYDQLYDVDFELESRKVVNT